MHRQQTVSEYTLTIVHYSVGRSDLKQYAGYCCGLNDMSMCGCFDCSRRHCNSRCALILPLSVFIIRCIHVLLFCQLSKPLQDVSPYWLFVVVVVVMPRPCTASVFFIFIFLFLHYCPPVLAAAGGWSDLHCHMQMSSLFRSMDGIIHAHPSLSTATTSRTPPLLIAFNQLYLLNMKTGLLQGRLGRSHCMQRSCSTPDKWPQLPNERQLHHCLHVTDGW